MPLLENFTTVHDSVSGVGVFDAWKRDMGIKQMIGGRQVRRGFELFLFQPSCGGANSRLRSGNNFIYTGSMPFCCSMAFKVPEAVSLSPSTREKLKESDGGGVS